MKSIVYSFCTYYQKAKEENKNKKNDFMDRLVKQMKRVEDFSEYDVMIHKLQEHTGQSKKSVCKFCEKVKLQRDQSFFATNCNRCKYCSACYTLIIRCLDGGEFETCPTRFIGRMKDGKEPQCALRISG